MSTARLPLEGGIAEPVRLTISEAVEPGRHAVELAIEGERLFGQFERAIEVVVGARPGEGKRRRKAV